MINMGYYKVKEEERESNQHGKLHGKGGAGESDQPGKLLGKRGKDGRWIKVFDSYSWNTITVGRRETRRIRQVCSEVGNVHRRSTKMFGLLKGIP